MFVWFCSILIPWGPDTAPYPWKVVLIVSLTAGPVMVVLGAIIGWIDDEW